MHRDTVTCLQIMDGPEKEQMTVSHTNYVIAVSCKTGFISLHTINIKGHAGEEDSWFLFTFTFIILWTKCDCYRCDK